MSSSRIYKNRDLYLNKLIAFQDTEPVKVVPVYGAAESQAC